MVGCVGTQVNMDQIIWYGGYGNILVCHKHVKYAFCRCLADTKVALKSQMFVCLSRIKTPKTGENQSLHLPPSTSTFTSPSIPTFIPPSTSPSSPSDTSTNYTIHQFTNLVPPQEDVAIKISSQGFDRFLIQFVLCVRNRIALFCFLIPQACQYLYEYHNTDYFTILQIEVNVFYHCSSYLFILYIFFQITRIIKVSISHKKVIKHLNEFK